MTRIAVLIVCLVLASVAPVAAQQSYTVHLPVVLVDRHAVWQQMIADMDGEAYIYASTMVVPNGYFFDGLISSDPAHPDSIINLASAYGDPSHPFSITNPAGPYGSPDSPYSAFDPDATDPPRIVWPDGGYFGYDNLRLTTNRAFAERIDPEFLLAELRNQATQSQ